MTAEAPRTHGLLIGTLRQSAGPDPVLVGPSAAFALGCDLVGEGAVHAAMGPTRGGRADPDLVAYRHAVDPTDVVHTPYGWATSPRRTAVDLARGVGLGEVDADGRVAWVDALLRATSLRAADAVADARTRTRMAGLPVARQVIGMARDGVDSVKETELRLLVVRHGFVEPVVQTPVTTATGRIVASLDLGWQDCRLGLEYDGAVHRQYRQHSRDLQRHNLIRALGWTVIQIDARALASPDEWLAQLAALGAPRVR